MVYWSGTLDFALTSFRLHDLVSIFNNQSTNYGCLEPERQRAHDGHMDKHHSSILILYN